MQLYSQIGVWTCGLLLLQCLSWVEGRVGLGPGAQDWDYVEVRKGAHLFYWLHYTTANVSAFTERPLVIWLQGGPGVASSGCGVFEQLGAIDIEGRPRDTNWVQHMNVLFIDSPVGTGFSYVESHGRYARNNSQIARDLVSLMQVFLRKYPQFQAVPLHIFSESYGGKMAPEFALELHLARQRGQLKCRLESVAVGNPWTSPLDSILAYAPFLLQLGIVDDDGYRNISRVAAQIAGLVYAEKWIGALEKGSTIQDVIGAYTDGVFLYNTQRRVHLDEVYRYGEDPKLSDFMRSNVTEVLGLSHMPEWMLQNATVFMHLGSEIFRPAIHIVTRLLDETSIRVGVYSGILDLLCATPGTVNWINRMRWRRKAEYAGSTRKSFRIDGMLEGYEKHGGGLSMFWVYRAGHLVQQENPAAMAHILRYFTSFG
ncbi:retinoid-inducible serine carboxypeptidase [Drosophila subobscura]|uniref:retinoid-inducible serine carboxypeptidase n=1 Tax=Drosophila subobscura TaxID=7241 RepID=UPI00155AEC14|nr:retinoid-inducible serine carboxypeptidase [Drosophila subobscura]